MNRESEATSLHDVPAYSVAEAAHYLRLPDPTLRSWCIGQWYVYKGERRFFEPLIVAAQTRPVSLSFFNLIEAHVLSSIRRRYNIGLPRIREALDYLVTRLKARRPLLEEQFAVLGVDLFVERLDQIINVSKRGQTEMPDLIRAYLTRIVRSPNGLPQKLYLFTREQPHESAPRTVAIDPTIAFGRPVIEGTAVPTAVLAERFSAGENVAQLAQDYGTSEEAIEDALRCEVEILRAA